MQQMGRAKMGKASRLRCPCRFCCCCCAARLKSNGVLQEMSQEQMEEAMKNATEGQGQDGEGQQIEMSMDMQQPSGEGKEGEEEDA